MLGTSLSGNSKVKAQQGHRGLSQHLMSNSLTDAALPSRLFQAPAWALSKPEGPEGRQAVFREGICSDPRVTKILEKSRGQHLLRSGYPTGARPPRAGGWRAGWGSLTSYSPGTGPLSCTMTASLSCPRSSGLLLSLGPPPACCLPGWTRWVPSKLTSCSTFHAP